jgi:ABC-2 type transport system ATP-binding protein
VLLLDEPTTGVDPVTRQDFWQLIIRLAAESPLSPAGVSILVTTPYMDEASRCHRVGFMRSGKLLLEGTPTELRARLNGQIVEVRGQPLPLLRQTARADAEVEDVQMFGDRLHLRVKAGAVESVINRLREHVPSQGGTLALMREVTPQLEDVFISLLEDGV